MAINHVRIHGVALASLLQSAKAGRRDCDGLLFGTLETRQSQLLQDDGGPALVVETIAHVNGCLCLASVLSFYNGAGDVDVAALENLTSGTDDTLLGWFSYRASSICQPSMREAAVTASLCQVLPRRSAAQSGPPPAVLFAIITTSDDHNGATLSLQYRFFQRASAVHYAVPAGQPAMQAVPLKTVNLAHPAPGAGAVGFSPVAVAALGRRVGGAPPVAGPALQRLAALAGLSGALQGEEEAYQELMAQLQVLSAQMEASEAELSAIRDSNERLLTVAAAAQGT